MTVSRARSFIEPYVFATISEFRILWGQASLIVVVWYLTSGVGFLSSF